MRGVLPANGEHVVQLLDLLEANGAAELERTDVVARHDETIRLKKRVVVSLALVDDRIDGDVTRPPVIADRPRQVIDLRVVRDQQPALHR